MSSDGAIKLHHALKTMRTRWDLAKDQWNDAVSRDFETNHLGPLEDRTEAAIRGMDKLSEVLAKMKRECS
jgi:hypothetical protein